MPPWAAFSSLVVAAAKEQPWGIHTEVVGEAIEAFA
jgi:hypothetical protein